MSPLDDSPTIQVGNNTTVGSNAGEGSHYAPSPVNDSQETPDYDEAALAQDQLLAEQEQQELLDAVPESTYEVSASRGELVEGCRVSLDFLASLIITEIYAYGYPAALQAVWQMICAAALTAAGKPKYALGIPRGFSKTILLKLYVVWLVLFSDRRFILVVCNTATHANNFIADVQDMLSCESVLSIFGDWRIGLEKDTQELKKFNFRGRSIILAGIGSGGSVRGLNIKYRRPDIVLMDDMQNREEAANPDIAREMFDWMLGTLMKACHPQKCVFIFVGNMYPFEGSILKKLKHSKEWIAFITGAILADGESLWPEHRSIEDLLQELAFDTEQGRPQIFFSEVMNDEESGTVSGLDVSKIPDCPAYLDLSQAQGGFVIIDPSLGKKTSDDVAIGAVLLFDGKPVLVEVSIGKFDPGTTIKNATFLAAKYNMQLIVVEGVAYQATLKYWFDFIFMQMGISGIQVGLINPAGMAKNSRIVTMFKMLVTGKILLHKDVRSAVIYQATQFNPLKTKNKDDLLDILAYIFAVIEEHGPLLPLLIVENWENEVPEAAYDDTLELDF